MDLSGLSTEDLQALKSGDLSKVSTAGLQTLRGGGGGQPATPPHEMSFGDQLLGNAELAGSAIANIPHGILHAGSDIYNRLTGDYSGKDPGWIDALHVEPGREGKELSTELGNALTDTLDKAGAGPALTKTAGAVQNFNDEHPFVSKVVEPLTSDVTTLAGARAPVISTATKVGNAVRSGVEGGMDAAGFGTDWRAAGLRSGGGHPIARQVAGDSGPEALIGHNAKVGNVVSASEAGHPQGTPMSPESLAESRQAPNSVYNRLATSLPEGPLSDSTRNGINSIDSSIPTGTKSSIENINNLKQTLLGKQSWNGQELVNTLRDLRQKGFANAASDVPDAQEFGKAQLAAARALEGHIEGAIPANGPVSIEQFQAARQQLAKNWAVQGALRGSDVDLAALGRIEEKNPGTFTGGLKTLADFANGPGRDVVGIPERYNPPSFAKDIAGVFNVHRPVQATAQGLGGGMIARRLLTGDTGAAIDRAKAMFPGAAPDAFSPLPSAQLPGGRLVRPGDTGPIGDGGVGTGANPNPSPPAPTGDFAGVMSQGVGQAPAGGPSMSFHGAPREGALPFRFSPEVVGERPVQGGSPQLAETTDDYGNRLSLSKSNSPGAQFETEPEPQRPALGDRLAGEPEPPPTNRGTVQRFGPVSAETGSEGRVVSTPVGEPKLGDILSELRAMVGEGVPGGTAAKAGPRTGPSKPWLVDADRPGNDRGFENLMEDIHGEDPLSNNASGQTDVSQEFANWQSERQAAGVTRHRYDPATDEMVPMHSTSARDPSSVQGRPVFDRDANGKYTVVDRGGMSPNALNGIIARMTRLGDFVQ